MSLREKILGKTGLKVKTLGFGGIPIQHIPEEEAIRVVRQCYELGINYYDTAREYTVSEERIGKALEDFRKHVIIASKTHAQTKKDALKEIDISLNNLRTDYIDIYQLHRVSSVEEWNGISAPGGVLEALHDAKDKKKIHHIGVTSHNIDFLKDIVKEGIIETIMVPLNYLTPEDSFELLPLCKRMNVGTVIMKPFVVGALKNASAVLKFLLANDDVDVIIPGMQSLDEVEENVAIASGTYVLTADEKKLIEKDRKELGMRSDYSPPPRH